MHRLLILTAMSVVLTACTTTKEVKPEPPDSAMEKAVTAPLVDLNLLRKKIPDVPRDAKAAPYRMPDIATCDTLGLEIQNLNVALGTDLDGRIANRDGGTIMQKGAEEASDAAADALKDLTTGWIPYRGWVRRLIGAERHSREVAKHVAAGITRRAFLKGLGQSRECVPPAAPSASGRLLATWRLVKTQPALWIEAEMALDRRLLGQSLLLEEDALTGPHPLVCEDAEIESFESSPDGLFEGSLPAPVEVNAHNLGFTAFPAQTVRIACKNANFDLHRVNGDTLLFALDNQIWTLASPVGTHAAVRDSGSPKGIVQQLLEAHFAGPMEFRKATVDNKRAHLTPALSTAIDHYFATMILEGEVPPINGDPFTDSQEYPARFSVDAATVIGDTATVPVRLADAWRQYRVVYHLSLTKDGWRVFDLVYRDGSRLT